MIRRKLIAYAGAVVQGSAIASSQVYNCILARTGTGVYTMTLPMGQGVDATEAEVHVRRGSGTNSFAIDFAHTSSVLKTIHIYTKAAADQDANFSVAIYKIAKTT